MTDVGHTWQQVRGRMKRLRHAIDQEYSVEWCWSIENNPKATGLHVHAWQRGSYIPQKRLSELASGEGMGVVADIRFVEGASRRGVQYTVKSAGYTLKQAAAGSLSAQEWIALNGGRLTHQSRSFFGSNGVRVCEREALADHFGGTQQWEVRPDSIDERRRRARYRRWQNRSKPPTQGTIDYGDLPSNGDHQG